MMLRLPKTPEKRDKRPFALLALLARIAANRKFSLAACKRAALHPNISGASLDIAIICGVGCACANLDEPEVLSRLAYAFA